MDDRRGSGQVGLGVDDEIGIAGKIERWRGIGGIDDEHNAIRGFEHLTRALLHLALYVILSAAKDLALVEHRRARFFASLRMTFGFNSRDVDDANNTM